MPSVFTYEVAVPSRFIRFGKDRPYAFFVVIRSRFIGLSLR